MTSCILPYELPDCKGLTLFRLTIVVTMSLQAFIYDLVATISNNKTLLPDFVIIMKRSIQNF